MGFLPTTTGISPFNYPVIKAADSTGPATTAPRRRKDYTGLGLGFSKVFCWLLGFLIPK